MSRQRSQVSYRDRSPTPVQNLDRINNPKPRNITNFDMPVHRAGKRNINCRSATDNNIFNLQSLVNIRARGSGQPNQQINQRNHNKSSMGRSASFVNLDEIKVSKFQSINLYPHLEKLEISLKYTSFHINSIQPLIRAGNLKYWAFSNNIRTNSQITIPVCKKRL